MRIKRFAAAIFCALGAVAQAQSIPQLANLQPTVDLNFMLGGLPPNVTFSRASVASYFDGTGTLQSAASGVPRFDHGVAPPYSPLGLLIEEARTNGIRNNTAVGAVVGTPGTPPTNWSLVQPGSGISAAIVGSSTESGITYLDVSVSGTATATIPTNNGLITMETTTQIAARTGQVWSAGIYLRITTGSLPASSLGLDLSERSSSGSGVVTNLMTISPTSAALASQKITQTTTLNGGSTTVFLEPVLRFGVASGTVVNFTLRIGLPQLELGAFPTSAIPTSGAAATRAVDDALDLSVSVNPTAAFSVEAEYIPEQSPPSGNQSIITVGSGAVSRVLLYINTAATSVIQAVSASVPYSGGAISSPIGAMMKIALSWSGSAISFAGTSTSPVVISAAPVGLLSGLYLGQGGAGALDGYIQRVRYWPRILAPSELAGVTR